jgi:hypothetical protein
LDTSFDVARLLRPEYSFEEGELLKFPSVFNLRKGLVLTLTHLSGTINGCTFHGYGVGIRDLVSEKSINEIKLENFPESFESPMCKSWKCAQHVKPSVAEAGYSSEEFIRYGGAATGEIRSTKRVHSLPNGISMAFTTFDGVYEGPVGVEKILPCTDKYMRTDARKFEVQGTRELLVGGRKVTTDYSGMLTLVGDQVGEEALAGWTTDFTVVRFTWKNKDGNAHYRKWLNVAHREL